MGLSHGRCCHWLYKQCLCLSPGMSHLDKSQALCFTFIK